MKRKHLIYVPAVAFLTACGGGEKTETTETPKDSVVAEIQYAPLKTKEEVAATERVETLADFSAIADKATVIRYVSSEYNKPFPTELLDAYNLQVLSLPNMTGDIPADISKFKNLTTFVVSGDFTTLPESMSELQNLKVVSLEYCKKLDMAQAFGVLSKCPNIQYLNIEGCGLKELPASIGDFKQLVELRIGDNDLTSLPESLYTLSSLNELRIGENTGLDYNAVITSAKALPALNELWLQYCGFTALPAVLNEYPALETIHWREEWKDKNSDQIVAICEKENKKFAKLKITWDNMSGMYYDIF